jgi:hypothetical protein
LKRREVLKKICAKKSFFVGRIKMRKWVWIILSMICFSEVFAESSERIETLAAKVILSNSDGYFVLSDGSFWKVIGFSKRWRSLSEWWNNTPLMVSEDFDSLPNDWPMGAQMEIHTKYESPIMECVKEADASNQEILKQCSHLLRNKGSGKILFAISIHPAECFVQAFQEARNEGYHEGYSYGYSMGYSMGHSAGYSSGYQAGHSRN